MGSKFRVWDSVGASENFRLVGYAGSCLPSPWHPGMFTNITIKYEMLCPASHKPPCLFYLPAVSEVFSQFQTWR